MGEDPKTDVYATTEPGADTRGSTMDMAAVAPLPAAGYDVGDVIGRGGMGEVYEARDLRIDRRVALKRMRDRDGGESLSRFMREARIQARLEHPAVVPVYEIGNDEEGRPYFTMRKLVGQTLSYRLADGGSLNRILRAFVDVCYAIEYAHFHGVIHRDLKPSNVMLGRFGEVYVLDWGVARVLADAHDDAPSVFAKSDIQTFDETKTGAMLGTPGYMAPEQLRGLTPTPAADVYALGAILFEILSREPLHPRGESAVGSTLVQPQASPLQRHGGDRVPPELDAICMAALAEDPTARPSAHELGEAVQDYLDGDRDYERRRRLAATQLASARDALASDTDDARATAMRRAGRALALDPESKDAAELVSSLLLEPPAKMPPALVADLDEHERKMAQHRSWRSVLGLLSIIGLAPLMVLLNVTSWAMVGAFYTSVALCVLVALRSAQTGRGPIVLILICNLGLAVMFTRIIGPFILTPLAICGILVGITAIRRINQRRWLVVTWAVSAVLAPFVLEYFGVLPRSWHIGDGSVASHSSMFTAQASSGEVFALVVANLVFTVVVGLVALAYAIKRQDMLRQLFIREWHLRQLIPDEAPKPTWATKLR
jgi:serine/threonine-protein kinase